MQRAGAHYSLVRLATWFLSLLIGALVAGLLLPAVGIVVGGGIIAMIVNAFIGACGMFFQLLTTVLGIAGVVFASMVGQLIGWYLDQGTGVIASTLGAMVIILIWRRLVAAQVILDTKSLSVLRRAP